MAARTIAMRAQSQLRTGVRASMAVMGYVMPARSMDGAWWGSWKLGAEGTAWSVLSAPCMIPHASPEHHTFAPRASYKHTLAAADPDPSLHSPPRTTHSPGQSPWRLYQVRARHVTYVNTRH
jgi:hypothetical protein